MDNDNNKDKKIQIFVKDVEGKIRTYEVTQKTTFNQIFIMIQEREGINSEEYWLGLNGKPLSKSTKSKGPNEEKPNIELTLFDYDIKDGTSLQLNKRFNGGIKTECLISAQSIEESFEILRLKAYRKKYQLPLRLQ